MQMTQRRPPGVLEVFTHENTGELQEIKYAPGGGGPATSMQGFGPEIHHDGQIVAMVVADTFEAAREGAYRLKITYAAERASSGFGAPGVSETPVKKGDTERRRCRQGVRCRRGEA